MRGFDAHNWICVDNALFWTYGWGRNLDIDGMRRNGIVQYDT